LPFLRRKERAGRGRAHTPPKTAVTPLAPVVCVNPTRKGLRTMHTVAFHISLSLIESLVPILAHLEDDHRDRPLARSLRTAATGIAQALAAARLAARTGTARRHRERALAQTRQVHALLRVAHAWHFALPGQRGAALARAQHLAELLGAPLL
jgi:hypothetical protein